MNSKRKKVLDVLDESGIHYTLMEHAPVETIEEAKAIGIDEQGGFIKNLFLCDDKKTRFILICLPEDKSANLKEIKEKLGLKSLSFASEKRLDQVLGLKKGEVSPLGVLNDEENKVEVVFDKEIKSFEKIGIHPNDNTATILVETEAIEQIIKEKGNHFAYMDL